jgi:mRNA interferase HigB
MGTQYIVYNGNICYHDEVRIIARSTLKNFYEISFYGDSKDHLEAWYHEAKKATWSSWTNIKEKYGSASILKNNRVVFNICGNKYRLVVKINYEAQVVYVRFIGTHKEYDQINAEEI